MRTDLGVTGLAVMALGAAACGGGSSEPPPAREDLIVQSTTSVRDSGLLERLIGPEFERRHPRWNLKFLAVGSGEAIANARAGQADVLIAHSPKAEKAFVADGFSAERTGRTVMWNDFVIVGPPDDPAGVRRLGRHDAVGAMRAIAAAGAAGRAHFVSRGDESGTNVKELDLWALAGMRRTSDGEPARGSRRPAWYRKAGLGMADTLRLTEQCPFGRDCYTITDRGTLQQLAGNGAIRRLAIVMDGQTADAKGGAGLMLNVYDVYAINPAKYPRTKIAGARAFMQFLTSRRFQQALERYPSRERPGFFPAAAPRVRLTSRPPASLAPGQSVTVAGRVESTVPAAAAPAGLPLALVRSDAGTPLARARTAAGGAFRLTGRVERSGELVLSAPRFGQLSALRVSVGRVSVP
ncbi:MAG TPA: substrate-binding domain-containing protein [Solirubrobacteraceae bacterium]|nr:substrate-binding domain-containing protein [Solirubrobacteraceae bacterium]